MKSECLECSCYKSNIQFRGKLYCYCFTDRDKKLEFYRYDSCRDIIRDHVLKNQLESELIANSLISTNRKE